MHKILISHEIPKSLFSLNKEINDYPYVLAHLLIDGTEHYDEEYASFYTKELEGSPYSILDNSCFELGASIPSEDLLLTYFKYKPTHLVLPDVMGDLKRTISLTKSFLQETQNLPIKYIAVVQGSTAEEYEECWRFYNEYDQIEVIGVNYRDVTGATRLSFLNSMFFKQQIIKKIHLLGCRNPQEFQSYLTSPYRDHIVSVDTSSPIIHGWQGNQYDEQNGIGFKPKGLLADNLNISLSEGQKSVILHNVKLFKRFVNGI